MSTQHRSAVEVESLRSIVRKSDDDDWRMAWRGIVPGVLLSSAFWLSLVALLLFRADLRVLGYSFDTAWPKAIRVVVPFEKLVEIAQSGARIVMECQRARVCILRPIPERLVAARAVLSVDPRAVSVVALRERSM